MASYSKKVCLLGEFAVGKTSLVRRFVYNRFDEKYLSTIGVKVSRKTVSVPRGEKMDELNMLLWDLAGSERFTQMWDNYLRGAAGAVLVCDLTRRDTLDSLQKYVDHLFETAPDAQIIIAANKVDRIDDYQLSEKDVENFARQFNASYHLTSAREGNEVDSLFRELGRILLT